MWFLGKLLGENWATLHREVFPWPCGMNILLRVGCLCFFSHLYIHSDLGEVASLCFGLRAKGLSFFEGPQLGFSIFGPQRVCGYHFPVNIHMPSHLYGPRITSLGPGPPDSYALQTYLLHHKVPLWLLGLCRRNSSTARLGPKRTDLRSLVFMIKFSTLRHWKALALLSPHQWEASPMLGAGSKGWEWGGREPSGIPRSSGQTDGSGQESQRVLFS